jgi:hypothetical protein
MEVPCQGHQMIPIQVRTTSCKHRKIPQYCSESRLGFQDDSFCQNKAHFRHCKKNSNGAELNLEYEFWSSFASAHLKPNTSTWHDYQPLHRPLNQPELQSEEKKYISSCWVSNRMHFYDYFSTKCKIHEDMSGYVHEKYSQETTCGCIL